MLRNDEVELVTLTAMGMRSKVSVLVMYKSDMIEAIKSSKEPVCKSVRS